MRVLLAGAGDLPCVQAARHTKSIKYYPLHKSVSLSLEFKLMIIENKCRVL